MVSPQLRCAQTGPGNAPGGLADGRAAIPIDRECGLSRLMREVPSKGAADEKNPPLSPQSSRYFPSLRRPWCNFDWVRGRTSERRKSPGFPGKAGRCLQAGEEQIGAVIDDVSKPSEAYISPARGNVGAAAGPGHGGVRILQEKGWDVIAKRLGIRPGSRDYRKLKAGQGSLRRQ